VSREVRWGRFAPWLAAIGVVLTVPIQLAIMVGLIPNDSGWLGLIVVVAVVAWAATGWLLGTRRPENPIGLIFAAEALLMGYASVQIAFQNGWPNTTVNHVLIDTQGYLVPLLLAIPLVILLFPTGRPPTRRWNVVLWLMAFSAATGFIGLGLAPEDSVEWSGLASSLTSLSAVTGLLAAGLAIVAVIVRYRRSRGDEREQMRWLALVAILGGAFFVATATSSSLDGSNGDSVISQLFFNLLVLTMAVGLPAAIGIAITRYRLYEIDVVIKKTLVALVLTLLIVVPSLTVFLMASAVLSGADNTRLILLGGIAIGVLVVPALRLARRIANRITYGRRATPYELMTAFGERVSEAYSIDDVLPRLAQILATGTGATSARVLLRVGSGLREMAAYGTPDGDETFVPVNHQGEDVGALAVTFPPNDPIDAEKERLIGDLATQAGLVLRNTRLLEELRASRQRLVAAQDEERRKIERNLHDGVQQQLVAMNVQLGLLARVAEADPAKAVDMATLLQTRSTEALNDLRDLARGIYPPLLADKGLVAALEAQARKAAVPTTVACEQIDRYPRAIESAVYFCSLEALNNIAKYAGASHATIDLAQHDGHVTFRVYDDGAGFDPATTSYGTGLQGMADRLDAIGGDLTVMSTPGSGTTVAGRVPVS